MEWGVSKRGEGGPTLGENPVFFGTASLTGAGNGLSRHSWLIIIKSLEKGIFETYIPELSKYFAMAIEFASMFSFSFYLFVCPRFVQLLLAIWTKWLVMAPFHWWRHSNPERVTNLEDIAQKSPDFGQGAICWTSLKLLVFLVFFWQMRCSKLWSNETLKLKWIWYLCALQYVLLSLSILYGIFLRIELWDKLR